MVSREVFSAYIRTKNPIHLHIWGYKRGSEPLDSLFTGPRVQSAWKKAGPQNWPP